MRVNGERGRCGGTSSGVDVPADSFQKGTGPVLDNHGELDIAPMPFSGSRSVRHRAE